MHPWPHFLLKVLKITAGMNQFKRFGISLKILEPFMSKESIEQRDKFFRTAKGAVDRRLAREKEGGGGGGGGGGGEDGQRKRDIIGLMLREMKGGDRLTEPEILSNSILVVGGGAETTSTCLSATFYHLCKAPRAMQKLTAETRGAFKSSEEITLKAVAELPYLEATIDESLRIFPVASYITPRLTPKGGHVIDGEVVPGNTYVSVGQWYMGRSERFYDDAKEFRPERWINSEVQKTSGRRADEILKPFSLGPRNCVGKLLALAEAKLVTAKLLWHFDMELYGDQPNWVEDARFYVLWQLQPLNIKLKPVER